MKSPYVDRHDWNYPIFYPFYTPDHDHGRFKSSI